MAREKIKTTSLEEHDRVVAEHERVGFREVCRALTGGYRSTVLSLRGREVHVYFDPDNLGGHDETNA
jgi:hypothetical protein